MPSALTIGGTRFIGRHTVTDLLANGYEVTTLTRGTHDDPFADVGGVTNVRGDRNDRAALERAREAADPDLVIDLVGYFPAQVETAVEVFADVDAYVLVSSGSAYDAEGAGVPWREGETPLHECSDEQATDESMATYGPRKAACDRVCFRAADEGVNAMSVRPMLVYGPHDYTERSDYWYHQVATNDRVLVPGDGGSLLHRAYAPDVASALRIVGERGTPGEAYNVADRAALSLTGWLDRAAAALGTEYEAVTASERELATEGLAPTDFPLYTPTPALVATEKLAALGWDSTALDEAYATTVAEHRESGRTGDELGPDREAATRLVARLAD